jgi:Ring finger domain
MAEDNCAICFEPLNWPNVIDFCPANHKFHKKCIKTWINNLAAHGQPVTCPLCRAIVDPEVLKNLDNDMWEPITIILNGSTLVVSAALVRSAMIFIGQYLKYVDARDNDILYNHLIADTQRRLIEAEDRFELANEAGSSELLGQRALNISNIRGRLDIIHERSREGFAIMSQSIDELYYSTGILFCLSVILGYLLAYRISRSRRLGGDPNNKGNLCVNDECVNVPEKYHQKLQEIFDHLKTNVHKMMKLIKDKPSSSRHSTRKSSHKSTHKSSHKSTYKRSSTHMPRNNAVSTH